MPLVSLLLGATALGWIGGFFWYVGQIPAEDEPIASAAETTDGIVVLTGGSERVAAGLALLREGAAKRLLLTGVHAESSLADILSGVDGGARDMACCIDLGRAAQDTPGNARETAHWIREQGYGSLRLVTGNYHMPRSIAEFHSAMPDVEIVAHPVFPDGFRLGEWWQRTASASLIASEYNKFLWGQFLAFFTRPAP